MFKLFIAKKFIQLANIANRIEPNKAGSLASTKKISNLYKILLAFCLLFSLNTSYGEVFISKLGVSFELPDNWHWFDASQTTQTTKNTKANKSTKTTKSIKSTKNLPASYKKAEIFYATKDASAKFIDNIYLAKINAKNFATKLKKAPTGDLPKHCKAWAEQIDSANLIKDKKSKPVFTLRTCKLIKTGDAKNHIMGLEISYQLDANLSQTQILLFLPKTSLIFIASYANSHKQRITADLTSIINSIQPQEIKK